MSSADRPKTNADIPTIGPFNPWETFKRSAFRLETLPEYRVPDEERDLERYLAGEPQPKHAMDAWHAKIRSFGADGKIVQRVRVVRPPLTDYLRMEFEWGYVGNLAAGEDIRVLDGADADRLGLPDWDFWFFDDEVVLRQVYAEDGTLLRREVLPDPDLAEFRRYRDVALTNAIVFHTYRALTGT